MTHHAEIEQQWAKKAWWRYVLPPHVFSRKKITTCWYKCTILPTVSSVWKVQTSLVTLISTRPSLVNFHKKKAEPLLYRNKILKMEHSVSTMEIKQQISGRGKEGYLKHRIESQTFIKEYRIILWERSLSFALLLLKWEEGTAGSQANNVWLSC